MMIQWQDATVVSKHQWDTDLYSLTIHCEQPVTFKPGQFLNIGLQHNNETLYRPYSLVNTPDQENLTIHFNAVRGGKFSPLLAQLSAGDNVLVPAKGGGLLTLDATPKRRQLWLCATGTGIGPFLSLLRSQALWQTFEQIIVCYATKTRDGMAYFDELANYRTQYPKQYHFLPYTTQQSADDSQQQRFTTALINGDLDRLFPINAKDSHFMLCGNSAMINEMSDLLTEKGLSPHSRLQAGNISIEKYF